MFIDTIYQENIRSYASYNLNLKSYVINIDKENPTRAKLPDFKP